MAAPSFALPPRAGSPAPPWANPVGGQPPLALLMPGMSHFSHDGRNLRREAPGRHAPLSVGRNRRRVLHLRRASDDVVVEVEESQSLRDQTTDLLAASARCVRDADDLARHPREARGVRRRRQSSSAQASAELPASSDHRRPRSGRSVHQDPPPRAGLRECWRSVSERRRARARQGSPKAETPNPLTMNMTTGLVGLRRSAHTRQGLDARARPGRGVVWIA